MDMFNESHTCLWAPGEWVPWVSWTPWCRATCLREQRGSGKECPTLGVMQRNPVLMTAMWHLKGSIPGSKYIRCQIDLARSIGHTCTSLEAVCGYDLPCHFRCERYRPLALQALRRMNLRPKVSLLRRTLVHMQMVQFQRRYPLFKNRWAARAYLLMFVKIQYGGTTRSIYVTSTTWSEEQWRQAQIRLNVNSTFFRRVS